MMPARCRMAGTRLWCSGNTEASQASDEGSIPFRRSLACTLYRSQWAGRVDRSMTGLLPALRRTGTTTLASDTAMVRVPSNRYDW